MSDLRVSVSSGPDIAVYPPGATFGPRRMTDYEFVWNLEGTARYTCKRGREVRVAEMPEGSLVLCRPNYLDEFIWDPERRTLHGFFHFRVLEASADWGEPDDWPLYREFEEGGLFATLAAHMLTSAGREPRAQLDLCATLFLSAFISGEAAVGRMPHQRPPDTVERALDFIYRRLEEAPDAALDLETIAKAAFVTPEHLCRVFKKATGRSPLETVRLARLDRAAVLLARSNFGVAEVARLTGFVSPFHFSRAFKAAYQISPRELQQKVAAGEILPLSRLVGRLRN
jgi:AraC-like DNA-binding protein